MHQKRRSSENGKAHQACWDAYADEGLPVLDLKNPKAKKNKFEH